MISPRKINFALAVIALIILGIILADFFKTPKKVIMKPIPAYVLTNDREYGIAGGSSLVNFSQADLNDYFTLLSNLGVKWIRLDIDWSIIQPDNSTDYQWGPTDRVARAAKRFGIKSLGVITYAPKWAALKSCKEQIHCMPEDANEFGRFAGDAALRYKDLITYWEVWNEPNSTTFWKPKPDAEKYADILGIAYTEIKKVDPQSIILSGGLASSGNDKDGNISPLSFTMALYAIESNKYFDALSIHPYTYPSTASNNVKRNSWQDILPIRELMKDHGDGEKQIWITEYGAPTDGPGKAFSANKADGFNHYIDFMSEAAQGELLREAVNFYRQNSDWMGPFFWYTLRDSGDKKDSLENFFGLIRYDGSYKPAYEVFKNLIYN